ncbi:hypothetical protein [Paenibacillus sp. y28]|uniref:hypothetical protein n=1 Tax=Paenibacillus sp. y28 TaxID=3129110 RepID=UPI00301A15E9
MTHIGPFMERIRSTLQAHRLEGCGTYARYLPVSAKDEERWTDVYGTADAAIILYTMDELPRDPEERTGWILNLQGYQEPATGMFRGQKHHEIHSTAFALSALELFDAAAAHPLTKLVPLQDPAQLSSFLNGLDWVNKPWSESHLGAGIYACMVLSGAASPAWEEAYFRWLWDNADPQTGLWRKGCVADEAFAPLGAPIFHHLAGSFHYLFNQNYRKKPLRYPEKLLDTALFLYKQNALDYNPEALSYFEVDWIYTIGSAMRQTDHRLEECRAAMVQTVKPFLAYIDRLGAKPEEPLPDLHSLCGAISGLAAIQQWLPELVQTDRPLQLAVDRRPFI